MSSITDRAAFLAERGLNELKAIRAVRKAGMLGGGRPKDMLAQLKLLDQYGPLGAGLAVSAMKYGDRLGVIDDAGALTFREMDLRANRMANRLRAQGICDGGTVGILTRNHRYALDAIFGAARAGARTVYLNTSFAAPQVRDVSKREGVQALIVDEELLHLCDEVEAPKGIWIAWGDGAQTVEEIVTTGDASPPPKPQERGGIVLLTSGTTGTPKGAQRKEPKGMLIPGMLLDRIPLQSEGVTAVCAPLFHATGFAMCVLSIGLGTTSILRRKFDAQTTLDDLEKYAVDGMIVVPILLQRLLALGEEEIGARDLSKLRVVFCAGSQLPGEVSDRAAELLGDVIYNLYGSTEVSVATIATPQDLREAPGTTGLPVLGTKIRLLDDAGRDVRQGEVGRIFVGSATSFEGYTGGGNKEVIDGYMSTGDVGHFDAKGRLFIDGRDDEMIVSGGENVFPREVEELLVRHEAIDDAAAIGVADDEFGQRLRAFVVLEDGESLDQAAVQAYVKENLARYKVPREVVFLEELPRNPSGKILKRELAEIAV